MEGPFLQGRRNRAILETTLEAMRYKKAPLAWGTCLLVVMVSCVTPQPAVQTSKSTDIYGAGVIHHPVIVDMDVRNEKVTGSESGTVNDNQEALKQQAIANVLKEHGADVLVEPVFERKPNGGSKVIWYVTGYPAFYKNFRQATTADLPLLEAGVLQRATVAEVSKGPEPKKSGAAAAVIAVLVLVGVAVAAVTTGGG